MLGLVSLFLSKRLRYQVSQQFLFLFLITYLFVFHTSRCTAHRVKRRGAATQTQRQLLDYDRNPRLFIGASGNLAFKRAQLSSRPVILAVFCLRLRQSLPASHGPLPGQTKASSRHGGRLGEDQRSPCRDRDTMGDEL